MKRVLVVDPDTGGGIRQASVYLYWYLRKFYEVRFFSVGSLSSPPLIFKSGYSVVKEFKPDMIIVHDTSRIEPWAYIKILMPEIRLAYFSLCQNSHDDPNYISCFDYYLGPQADTYHHSSCHNSNLKKVVFMFDLPERFKVNNSFQKRKKNALLYMGRLQSDKFNVDFIKLLRKRDDLIVEAFGDNYPEDMAYTEEVRNTSNIKVFNYVPNGVVQDIYNNYRYLVLPSNTDCFSLVSIEMVACGGIPIVKRRFCVSYKWSNEMTPQPVDDRDLLPWYDRLESMPEKVLEEYVEEHRGRVMRKIEGWSRREILDELLDVPAPNLNYGDLYLLRDYLGENILIEN